MVQRYVGNALYAQDIHSLRQIAMFSGVNEQALQELAAVAYRRVQLRGEIIHGSADEDALFIVAEGRVRLFLLSPEGYALTLYHRGRGDLFELWPARIQGKDEPLAEVEEDRTVVYEVPRSNFLEIVALRSGAPCSLTSPEKSRSSTSNRSNVLPTYTTRHNQAAPTATLGSNNEDVTSALEQFCRTGLAIKATLPNKRTVNNPHLKTTMCKRHDNQQLDSPPPQMLRTNPSPTIRK